MTCFKNLKCLKICSLGGWQTQLEIQAQTRKHIAGEMKACHPHCTQTLIWSRLPGKQMHDLITCLPPSPEQGFLVYWFPLDVRSDLITAHWAVLTKLPASYRSRGLPQANTLREDGGRPCPVGPDTLLLCFLSELQMAQLAWPRVFNDGVKSWSSNSAQIFCMSMGLYFFRQAPHGGIW